MGVLSLQMDFPGQVGINPRRGKMITTDSNATVIAAGYLNSMTLMGQVLYPTDLIDAVINYNVSTNSGDEVTYQVAISNGVITLSQEINEGNVVFPVVNNDFAVFSGTAGLIKDAGYSASNAAKTKVVMANGTVTNGNFPTYVDTAGTIGTGLPPSAASQAYVAVSPGSLTAGNLIKLADANGTIADQGVAMKSVAQAAVAGGAAAQVITDAFCTTGSCVVASWNDTTNAVDIQKVTAGNGSFTVTSSADPGASHLNYIITK